MSRPSKRAAKVLRAARDLIARRGGWGQGSNEQIAAFKDVRVAYCALGALTKVGALPIDVDRVVAEIPPRAAATDYTGNGKLTHYNDGDTREKRDVVALFDRAIAKAEGR